MRLTRMGRFDMGDKAARPLVAVHADSPAVGREAREGNGARGERQMAALRRVPKLLRFVPGPAQDVRAYYLVLQYWLAVGGERREPGALPGVALRRSRATRAPPRRRGREYPDVGVYHPDLPGRVADDAGRCRRGPARRGRRAVGLLLMRSYVLAGNTRTTTR